jgi:hypothetical protein
LQLNRRLRLAFAVRHSVVMAPAVARLLRLEVNPLRSGMDWRFEITVQQAVGPSANNSVAHLIGAKEIT